MITTLLPQIFIKIQSDVSDQEKKRQRGYDLLKAETNTNIFSEIIRVTFSDFYPLEYLLFYKTKQIKLHSYCFA